MRKKLAVALVRLENLRQKEANTEVLGMVMIAFISIIVFIVVPILTTMVTFTITIPPL